MLSQDAFPQAERFELLLSPDAGKELASVIYIDHFGNLITGLRASEFAAQLTLAYKGSHIRRVRTFSDVPEGEPLCYENSSGLLEIAVNCGRAETLFNAHVGDPVEVISAAAST
jgi:S-adenosylmethionine hydrolase